MELNKQNVKTKLIIVISSITQIAAAQSQQADPYIRTGNDFYKLEQFEKAAIEYNKALEADPGNGIASFNLANTLYKQNKQEEAVNLFAALANQTGKIELKAKTFYNKGAVLSRQKKLEESIEAYKNVLRIAPGDREARENLQKALLELKKKNQAKKKEDNEKKKKQPDQPQSGMRPEEARQRLQLLAQKEKEVQQRIQKERLKPGGNQPKDW